MIQKYVEVKNNQYNRWDTAAHKTFALSRFEISLWPQPYLLSSIIEYVKKYLTPSLKSEGVNIFELENAFIILELCVNDQGQTNHEADNNDDSTDFHTGEGLHDTREDHGQTNNQGSQTHASAVGKLIFLGDLSTVVPMDGWNITSQVENTKSRYDSTKAQQFQTVPKRFNKDKC